jgi:hypothetical protein
MEKMREVVQQATSSSSQLAAMAEHSAKLSRRLIEAADSFVLEDEGLQRSGRVASRRQSGERERASADELRSELARV